VCGPNSSICEATRNAKTSEIKSKRIGLIKVVEIMVDGQRTETITHPPVCKLKIHH